MSHGQQDSVECLENHIKKVIGKIFKKKNRTCYQNVLAFINRNKPKMDMEQVKEIITDMENENFIINKDKRENEYFYLVEETLDCTIEGAEEIQDGDKSLTRSTSFIDEKLYEVMINNNKT